MSKAKTRRAVAPRAGRRKSKVDPKQADASPVAGAASAGDLIDLDEAIAILKTTRPTLYRWLRTGQLRGMKAGRQWRFDRAELERFIKGQPQQVEVVGDLAHLYRELASKEPDPAKKLPVVPGPHMNIIVAVNVILMKAYSDRATDVHFEPAPAGGGYGTIRFRIHGVLHDFVGFDSRLLPAINDRLKHMAGCDRQNRRLPQDGRISLMINGEAVEIRASFLPTISGEAATLRLLRESGVILGLDRAVPSEPDRARIKKALGGGWGMVLIAGPTGSGKTTTLYAMLQDVNTRDRKLIAVEDPVEFALPEVMQVSVAPQQGLTFAKAIRSALRHDPDAVMVGEVRDTETAEVCLQVALTGHLLLGTLHASDACVALQRLIDMGLPPYMVADSVRLVAGQRLLRVLCKACAQPTRPGDDQLRQAAELASAGGVAWSELRPAFHKAVGCKACGMTGYRGRVAVIETLAMSPEISAALLRRAGVAEIRKIAVSQGMTTLAADAVRRAAAGETSLDEALRLAAGV